MTKARRAAWIIVALLAVTIIGGGVWFHVHRNQPERLLGRARLAMEANRFDKAESRVNEYIARFPNDWEGYVVKAEIYLKQGKYDQARGPLEKARQLKKPDDPALVIGIASTYANAAVAQAGSLGQMDTAGRIKVMRSAVQGLTRANEVLNGFQADPNHLDIRQTAAMNDYRRAVTIRAISELLFEEAKIADAARNAEEATKKRSLGDFELIESHKAFEQAVDRLQDVVLRDPSRDPAAETLLICCLSATDPTAAGQDKPSARSLAVKAQAAMGRAREAIEAQKPPPPNATVTLAMLDFRASRSAPAKLSAIAKRLDEVVASNPRNSRAKLARVKIALACEDFATARRLAGEVLKTNSSHIEARLLHSQTLLCEAENASSSAAREAYAEIEKDLYEIKSRLLPENPLYAQANYLYALAAESTGKRGLAQEALRAAAKVSERRRRPDANFASPPVKPAPFVSAAEKRYAMRLMLQGAAEEAFVYAQPYYAQHPDDPEALRLLVDTARMTDQLQLATDTLAKAWKGGGGAWHGTASSPAMLLAVADAYASLGKPAEAQAALTELLDKASSPPKTASDAIAVADAMIRRKRLGEAEEILGNLLAKSPRHVQALGLLAKLYTTTNRYAQAEDMCRRAVAAEPAKPAHRLPLAKLLIDAGDLDEAQQVLAPVTAASPLAALLDIRIRQLKGEPIGAEARALLRRRDLDKRHRPLVAELYLAADKAPQCREICLESLQTDPGNPDLLATLASAYQAMGKTDQAIETWKEVVKVSPGSPRAYLQLCPLLVLPSSKSASGIIRMTAQEALQAIGKARTVMAAIPSARLDLVDLAVATVCMKARLYRQAAASYGKLAAHPGTAPFVRYQAQLRRAEALADSNQPDEALAILDGMIASQTGRAQARPMWAKANLLAVLGRTKDSAAALEELRAHANEARDTDSLARAAGIYARLGKTEQAVEVCREMRKLLPDDPRSYLVEAQALISTGQADKAPPLYEKAIELQPNLFILYDRLASLLDNLGRHDKALKAVGGVQRLGRAGRAHGLLSEGLLLTKWGLAAPAVERFKKLAEIQDDLYPDQEVAMAYCLRKLGRNDEAASALKNVPAHSDQYVRARLMLADMADGPDARLRIARELGQVKPGNPAALAYEMNLLLGEGKCDEALSALRRYQSDGNTTMIPAAAQGAALVAAARSADANVVSRIGRQVSQSSLSAQSRFGAALLAMDAPEIADVRPKPGEISVYPSMVNLCLASRAGDANTAAACAERLQKLNALLGRLRPVRIIAPGQMLLCGILGGKEEMARAAADRLTGAPAKQAAEELLSAAPDRRRSEAAELLRCGIARDLGLPGLSRVWAGAMIRARPRCQWAALELSLAGPTEAELKRLAETVQPSDCAIARRIQADLLMRSGRYGEAAKAFAALAAASGQSDPTVLEDHAWALEADGKLPEALAAYRKVWQAFKTPLSANNAACLIMELHADDPAKLAEAAAWMDEVLRVRPAPALAETAGWLAHLRGQNDKALALLRRAIKAVPDSPEAHYHLGTVEAAVGDPTLGRWHLEAAVDLGDDLKTTGKPIPKRTAEAIELARQAISAGSKP